MWFRRTNAPPQTMHLVHVPGSFEVLLDSQTETVRSTLHDGSGGSLDLILSLHNGTGELPIDEWILIAFSWDGSSGRFEGWAQGESAARVTDLVVVPGFVPGVPQGDLSIGQPDLPGAKAQPGVYGLIVFRYHRIDEPDVDDLWADRDYFGPYRLDNTGSGGLLTGIAGANWMANHAIITNPSEAVIGGGASAGLPANAVKDDNYCVFSDAIPQSTLFTAGNVSDLSSGNSSFIYISPYDASAQPFFVRKAPLVTGLPDPPSVAGPAPKTRQIAFSDPQGLIRCMVSSNSRATRLSDADDQTYPENYTHGFVQGRLAVTAGFFNRPARINSGLRWFGFDTLNGPARSGQNEHLTTSGPHQSFARFWTGSATNTIGPGQGIWMGEGADFALKCRPETGSLVIAEAPLMIRTYMLGFPGAGTLSWQSAKAVTQAATGTLGTASSIDLNTTTFTHTINSSDVISASQSTITLDGDMSASLSAGDAGFISAGQGQNGISVLSTVTSDGNTTEITFEHWFHTTPAVGSMLEFGPWSVVTVEYEWPALAADDPEIFRGLRLEAVGGPLVNFAWDAWRPDVDGIIFGVAGWGGNGYSPQIDESFAAAIPAWMQALEPDVWLQAFAQQNSEPWSMSDFHALIRGALPEIEAVWLGDGEHSNSDFASWHQYIVDEAATEGVLAATVVLDSLVGTIRDQSVDGLRGDGAHWSHKGNTRLAGRWLALLQDAALPSPDIDGDGAVGINDFLILLGTWGPCPAPPEPCPADLDGDGAVGINDFLILLGSWG